MVMPKSIRLPIKNTTLTSKITSLMSNSQVNNRSNLVEKHVVYDRKNNSRLLVESTELQETTSESAKLPKLTDSVALINSFDLANTKQEIKIRDNSLLTEDMALTEKITDIKVSHLSTRQNEVEELKKAKESNLTYMDPSVPRYQVPQWQKDLLPADVSWPDLTSSDVLVLFYSSRDLAEVRAQVFEVMSMVRPALASTDNLVVE